MSLRDDADVASLTALRDATPHGATLPLHRAQIIVRDAVLAEVADWCDRQAQRADVNGWCANTLGEVTRACRGEETR